MISCYLHGCHRNFYAESLLIRAIESLIPVKPVDKVSKADLIIVGPRGFYANKQPLGFHRVPKIRNYILSRQVPLAIDKHQITVFYSPEPPIIGHYALSNCMYGVASELIADDTTYFRLPCWMESIDWSDYGIRASETDRVGVKYKPVDLIKERNADAILRKAFELPIFTSHLNGFRAEVVKRLNVVMPVRGYGPHFDSSISHHSSSGFTKSEVLSRYAFNLCPENTIYPGYCTEKILEAYICDTIPVTLADPVAAALDFNSQSFINLYPFFDRMSEYLTSIVGNRSLLRSIASQPLFKKAPDLSDFLAFLKTILGLS